MRAKTWGSATGNKPWRGHPALVPDFHAKLRFSQSQRNPPISSGSLLSLLIAILALAFTGCASVVIPEDTAEDLRVHLRDRSYFLLEAQDLQFVYFDHADQSLNFHGEMGERIGLSTLTPVSEDGYFLTNEHSLQMMSDETFLWVVDFNRGAPYAVPAEVVWKSDRQADLGIVYAPLQTPEYFEWTDQPHPAPRGLELVQGGFRSRMRTGQLLWERPGSGKLAPHSTVNHSVKSRKGDSGGALITLDGRLLALNSQWRIYGGKAIRPDEQLIKAIIATHRMLTAADPARAVPTEISTSSSASGWGRN